jgi:hypothetical protein
MPDLGDDFFRHREKGLVGMAQPPKDNGGAVTVRMKPGAALTGEFVDEDGRPRVSVDLELTLRTTEGVVMTAFPERVITDREKWTRHSLSCFIFTSPRSLVLPQSSPFLTGNRPLPFPSESWYSYVRSKAPMRNRLRDIAMIGVPPRGRDHLWKSFWSHPHHIGRCRRFAWHREFHDMEDQPDAANMPGPERS